MVERVTVDLTGGRHGLQGGMFRYDALARLRRSAGRRDVQVLAFGFQDGLLRLVLDGEGGAIGNTLRGLKVGTVRVVSKWGLRLQSGPSQREAVAEEDLVQAVVWAHSAPGTAGGPLATPWSSHRDLLGFRIAPFYDPRLLDGRVSPAEVHERCGGHPLPGRSDMPLDQREDLSLLLRVSGGVLGVLPADRRCFRLFVHLARARGWHNTDIARALVLTGRRVRQLAAESAADLELALQTLRDPRLRQVP